MIINKNIGDTQKLYWTKVKTLRLNCLPSIYKIMQTKNAIESAS